MKKCELLRILATFNDEDQLFNESGERLNGVDYDGERIKISFSEMDDITVTHAGCRYSGDGGCEHNVEGVCQKRRPCGYQDWENSTVQRGYWV